MSDAGERHCGRVLDFAELVEYRVDAAQHGRERHDTLCQTVQGRVGVRGFESLSLRILAAVQVSYYLVDSVQRAP